MKNVTDEKEGHIGLPNVFVTGDAGFIGRGIVQRLLSQGSIVSGLDTMSTDFRNDAYRQHHGSILDSSAVREAMKGVDVVIHLAAEHKDFGVTQDSYFRVNRDGTKRLLAAAAELNVKKFIFFSSVAVYGDQDIPNEETVPQPSNNYGVSKLAAEELVVSWAAKDSKRSATIIRPTVVFGPHSRANIFKLIAYVCDRRFIWIGNGENIKSIAYVENLVDATMFLMERATPGLEIFNYADEPHMTTRELVDLIASTAKVPFPKRSIPLGVALTGACLFDILAKLTGRDFSINSARIRKFNTSTCYRAEKIRSLGFTPRYSIAQGLQHNIRWYIEEKKAGRIVHSDSAREQE